MLFLCRIHRKIASDAKQGHEISGSVQLCEILYTDRHDMLVRILPFAVPSRYNCCTDDSTNLGNYGCPSYFARLILP
jgi:hypothetical protein